MVGSQRARIGETSLVPHFLAAAAAAAAVIVVASPSLTCGFEASLGVSPARRSYTSVRLVAPTLARRCGWRVQGATSRRATISAGAGVGGCTPFPGWWLLSRRQHERGAGLV